MVRRPPPEQKIPGSNPAWHRIFAGSSHTSDSKIGTPVVTLPGAWRYRVSAGTGGLVSVYCDWVRWNVWSASSIPVCTIVWADPSLRYTSMLLQQLIPGGIMPWLACSGAQSHRVSVRSGVSTPTEWDGKFDLQYLFLCCNTWNWAASMLSYLCMLVLAQSGMCYMEKCYRNKMVFVIVNCQWSHSSTHDYHRLEITIPDGWALNTYN